MICLVSAVLVAAAGPYEQYQIASETTCIGPADKAFEAKDAWSDGGCNHSVSGALSEDHAEKKPAQARLGILAAVKDFSPATQANLGAFVAAFRKAGVSAIVVDGDSAYGVAGQGSRVSAA